MKTIETHFCSVCEDIVTPWLDGDLFTHWTCAKATVAEPRLRTPLSFEPHPEHFPRAARRTHYGDD